MSYEDRPAIRVIRGEGQYPCPECLTLFSNYTDLSIHLEEEHD